MAEKEVDVGYEDIEVNLDPNDDVFSTDSSSGDSDLEKEYCLKSKVDKFGYGLPDYMSAAGIHRAVLRLNCDKVRRCIESGEDINKKDPHRNLTPLHLAVIYDNLKMLNYLLTMEGIDVDAKCNKGRTPLFLGTGLGHIRSVQRLIQAGADINATDNNNDTPLHVSVDYRGNPDICHLLLRHGARIYTDDSRSKTLHRAVYNNCLEVVHMLLYYNVDANSSDELCCTPFMEALCCGNVEAQEILFEYTYDFNRYSADPRWYGCTMSFALHTNSPFVKDMIERGADVNYGDDPIIREEMCAFACCLLPPAIDLSTFKIVWERLRYNESKNTIDLLELLSHAEIVPKYLQIIIDSDNFETAVECLSEGEKYFLFVNKYAEKKLDLEQLTLLTCRLLEYGFRPSSYDVHAIFSHYGYCELFRILLYMDINFSRGWLPHMALTRLIFDIDFDLKSISSQLNDIPKDTVVQLLQYSVCPPLIDALTLQYSGDQSMSAILGSLPKVPILTELARNSARKHIWQSCKIANTCQFYTTIDHLCIPTFYKTILTFKRKMYKVKEESV